MPRPKLVIQGGGKMGEALAAGLMASGWASPSELAIVERFEARRSELSARWPDLGVHADAVEGDGVLLAVKPPDVEQACRDAAAAGVHRAVSIAAGVPIANLERWLGDGVPVVRSMPNMPAAVGAGATAIAAGRHAGEPDLAWAEEILSAVGVVVRVPESLLDAVTGLSGSGPAYVFLVAEALIAAGVANGLAPDVSATLAIQTIAGAGRLLAESGETPEALRAAVTTPGGTTAAALDVFEERGLRAAFVDAVTAAVARAAEMGREG